MSNLESALKYAARGFKIFPLHYINEDGKCSCNKPDCTPKNAGKHTIYKCAPHGHLDATSNTEVIKTWWTKYPNANIGLNCKDSGLIVVDVDLHEEDKNGFESLADFEFTHGEMLETTCIATTGGGGAHFFFKAPEGLETAPANFGDNYKGIDIKYRGYVLLAPSNHRSGSVYSWDGKSEESFYIDKIPALPKCVADFIEEATKDIKYSPARSTFAYRDIDGEELEQIRDALSYISPDACDYNEMLKVGMSLQYYLGDSNGWPIFLEWAQRSSKFKMKKCLKHWRSFRRNSGGVRSIASLFELASQNGFDNVGFNREMKLSLIDPADYVYMQQSVAPAIRTEKMHIDYSAKPVYEIPELYIDYNAKPDFGAPEMFIDWSARPDYGEVEIIVPAIQQPVINNFAPIIKNEPVNYKDSELAELMGDLKENGIDKNRGIPSKEVLSKWHAKLNNNPILCALFDYQMLCTRVFCPQMALGFALTAIGGILSGRFAMNNITTNLYFICTGGTSIGKTQTMNLLKAVYKEFKEDERIGSEDIRSDGGFRNELVENKSKTFMLDEIGLFLGKINNPRSPEAVQQINRSILNAFSGFGDKHNSEAKRADTKNGSGVTLSQVCPQIFGISTGVTLWENLSSKEALSGFLNRFLIMEVQKGDMGDRKTPKVMKVPDCVGQWYHAVRSRFVRQFGGSNGMYIAENPNDAPEILTEMRLLPDAELVFEAVTRLEQRYIERDPIFGQVWARLTEITKKVAMILQLAERPEATHIDERVAAAAFNLVKECITYTYNASRQNIADSKDESVEKKVLNVIKAQGAGGCALTWLYKNSILKGDIKSRGTIITALKSSGDIRVFIQKIAGKRGAPPKIVMAAEYCSDTMKLPEGWQEI